MLSVVIPSYNHKRYLLENVPRICSHLESLKIPHEMIIVDDGSTDDTSEAIRGLNCTCIKNMRNMGKGYSLRRGIIASNGEHIFTTDSDLAVPIEDFSRLWEHREHDLVFGSRRVGVRAMGVTPNRKVFGSGYYLYQKSLLSLPINDTQCGFKLFSSRVKSLAADCMLNGFAFDTELAYLAHKRRYSMKEVAVNWGAKPDSRVVLWKHPPQMFADVMRILYNDVTGVYG